ncbi:MAG: ASPIC/UnbV domain-containing protein, partial [Planctomycetota bacterium]
RLHFGLGHHKSAVTVKISWPNGKQESTTLSADTFHELTYGFSFPDSPKEPPKRSGRDESRPDSRER